MISTKLYRKLKKQGSLSATQASQIECYEFLQDQPAEALVFVQRHIVTSGIVNKKVTITTDHGQILGEGKLGKFFRNKSAFGYTLAFKATNGIIYKGIYYATSGYARVRKMKNQEYLKLDQK